MDIKDILIIGGGPAGCSAALYAIRYGLSVSLFEKMVFGGQVATTPEVENYPAIKHITGFDFSMQMSEQLKTLGLDSKMEEVLSVDLDSDIKSLTTSKGTYYGKTIIIATGSKRRLLGCTGELEFTGKGVSYCATCDGAFFKGKDVAIVGGGNTSLEDALFLANNCNKVYLIHRRNEFRAMKSLIDAVHKRANIELVLSNNVDEIIGDKKISSIKLTNGEILDVSALFIAIGTVPDTKIFENTNLNLDSSGYIIADESCQANIERIYVAGDNRTKHLRQIVTATSDGAICAFMAANYLNTN